MPCMTAELHGQCSRTTVVKYAAKVPLPTGFPAGAIQCASSNGVLLLLADAAPAKSTASPSAAGKRAMCRGWVPDAERRQSSCLQRQQRKTVGFSRGDSRAPV